MMHADTNGLLESLCAPFHDPSGSLPSCVASYGEVLRDLGRHVPRNQVRAYGAGLAALEARARELDEEDRATLMKRVASATRDGVHEDPWSRAVEATTRFAACHATREPWEQDGPENGDHVIALHVALENLRATIEGALGSEQGPFLRLAGRELCGVLESVFQKYDESERAVIDEEIGLAELRAVSTEPGSGRPRKRSTPESNVRGPARPHLGARVRRAFCGGTDRWTVRGFLRAGFLVLAMGAFVAGLHIAAQAYDSLQSSLETIFD